MAFWAGHDPPAVDSWDPTDEPADERRLPVRQPRSTGEIVAGVITGILVAVLVAGGLFVIVAFVLIGAGMSHWASNK